MKRRDANFESIRKEPMELSDRSISIRALRDASIASGVVLIATSLAILAQLTNSERAYRSELFTGLENVASIARSSIDPDALSRIESADQMDGLLFDSVAEPLRRIRSSVERVRYIYTLRPTEAGFEFLVDATPPGDSDHDGIEDRSVIGEPYPDAPQEAYTAWKTGRSTSTRDPYTDRWGAFASTFTPIFDRDGKVRWLLGVDMDASRFEAEMAEVRYSGMLGCFVALLSSLTIGALYFVSRRQKISAAVDARRTANELEASLHDLKRAKERAESLYLEKSAHISAMQRAEARLLSVAHCVSANAGDRFLEVMTKRMAEALDADVAMIAERLPENPSVVRSRTLVVDGVFQRNVRYELPGTPCESIFADSDACAYPVDVTRLFPGDHMLSDLKIEGYAGCPLLDLNGSAFGILVVLYRRPIDDAQSVTSMLRVFAARAGAEIERIHMLEQVSRTKDRLASTLEALNEGVLLFDRDGNIVECNPAAWIILGSDRESLLGCSYECLPFGMLDEQGNEIPARSNPISVSHSTGQAQIAVPIVIDRIGEGRIVVEMNTKPLRNEAGGVRSVVVSFSDITQRRAGERALEKAKFAAEAASRAKSEFLANMSHEIRTPMTAILGYAELLRDEMARATVNREWLDTLDSIHTHGGHLLALINDILDLSKIEAGKLRVERVAVDSSRIIDDAVDVTRLKLRGKPVELRVKHETEIPETIHTDPLRWRQILVNLLGNAAKFTESGSITLSLSVTQDPTGTEFLEATVTDTGIGMTPDEVARLFAAFEQVDASATRRYGGTGLGLRISRQLARLLGGDIRVKSTPGKGSSFLARIETHRDRHSHLASTPTPLATKRDPIDPMVLSGVRILLADDGRDNRRIISAVLARAGAKVDAVENGKIAIERLTVDGTRDGALIQPPPYDVVLLDMQMPVLDGYATARALRDKTCRLPIIAVTAHAMEGDRELCIQAGCDGHATKPVIRAELVATCRAAVDGTLSHPQGTFTES